MDRSVTTHITPRQPMNKAPKADKTVSGTYVQMRACPSVINIDSLSIDSNKFMPGVSYYGNADLSVDTPPPRPAIVSCSLVMTYTVGTTTNSVVLSTPSITWPTDITKMSMPFTFIMPDLGLEPNSSVDIKITMNCTMDCS